MYLLEVIERILEVDKGNCELFIPFPVLGMYIPPTVPTLRVTSRTQPSESRVLRPPALYTGEGNGTPLQYSCLENPMDGPAW